MTQMTVVGVLSAAVAVAGFAAGGAASAQDAGGRRDGDYAYQKICRYCHEGGVGPVLMGRELDPDYVRRVVRNGLRAMPAFLPSEIDDAALDELANNIHAGGEGGK